MAGLRPGFGRGGTIHSLLVRVIGGEVAPGEDTVEVGTGFMHNEGGFTAVALVDEAPTVGAGVEDIDDGMNGVSLNYADDYKLTSRFSQYKGSLL